MGLYMLYYGCMKHAMMVILFVLGFFAGLLVGVAWGLSLAS